MRRKLRVQEWSQRRRAARREQRHSLGATLASKMRGATVEDFRFLLNLSHLRQCIFIWDEEHKAVTRLNDDCSIPWPVVWSLARFNRKHIHAGRRLPDPHLYCEALVQWERKQRWAWALRRDARDACSAHFYRVPHVKCCPFPGRADAALEALLRMVRGTMMSTILTCRRRATLSRGWSNVLPVTRWGWRILRRDGLFPMINDKEWGYTVMTLAEFSNVHATILTSDAYEEHDCDELPVAAMCREYRQLCARVGRLHGADADDVARQLRRSLSVEGASATVKLSCTIKTHKAPGHVGFRNLHAGTRWLFSGLGVWADRVLSKYLRQLDHILWSTEDFVGKVKRTVPHAGERMVRIDLANFFISGSPASLAFWASRIVDDDWRLQQCLHSVLRWLLENQFIESENFPGKRWHVLKGSGMGLVHSSACCDAALYVLAEKPFAVEPTIMHDHMIRSFLRFRDDIWLLSGDRYKLIGWCELFREACKPVFIPEVVKISPTKVTMLAVDVTMVARGWSFALRARVQDGPPLSLQSAHAPHIHGAWQTAYIKSLWRLCSPASADDAAKAFVDRCKRFYTPRWLLTRLEKLRHRLRDDHSRRIVRPSRLKRSPPVVASWIVLPYHPAISSREVGKAARKLCCSAAWRALCRCTPGWDEPRALRISWTNLLSHSVHKLHKIATNGWRMG